MRSASGPTSSTTRRRISSAALFVKVMARIRQGATPEATRRAMRRVSTRVLPEPAPATTTSGPPSCSTASRWGGFRSATSSSMTSSGDRPEAAQAPPARRPGPGGRAASRPGRDRRSGGGPREGPTPRLPSSRETVEARTTSHPTLPARPALARRRPLAPGRGRSLPLDRPGRLGGDVVDDAVHARDLVDDPARDPSRAPRRAAAPSRPSWRPRS